MRSIRSKEEGEMIGIIVLVIIVLFLAASWCGLENRQLRKQLDRMEMFARNRMDRDAERRSKE